MGRPSPAPRFITHTHPAPLPILPRSLPPPFPLPLFSSEARVAPPLPAAIRVLTYRPLHTRAPCQTSYYPAPTPTVPTGLRAPRGAARRAGGGPRPPPPPAGPPPASPPPPPAGPPTVMVCRAGGLSNATHHCPWLLLQCHPNGLTAAAVASCFVEQTAVLCCLTHPPRLERTRPAVLYQICCINCIASWSLVHKRGALAV